MKKLLWLCVFSLLLTACASYEASAPVSDINAKKVNGVLFHKVQQGETLYAVAWRYELDYRDLARINKLSSPYAVYPGEDIRLNESLSQQKVKKQPAKEKSIVYIAPQESKSQTPTKKPIHSTRSLEPKAKIKHWLWPVKGRISKPFSRHNKGIDIAGRFNQIIHASAGGKVVYAGNGIREYGNLLIIKHNAEYLTAYAYNSCLLVKEGEWVKPGEKIAKMGNPLSGSPILHFEIRRKGKPVNPLVYL